MTEFVLKGLDGGNPLGFLAALGTLRSSALAWPDGEVRLSWSDRCGGWRPLLHLQPELETDEWLSGLDCFLRDTAGHKAFNIADDLRLSMDEFRENLLRAALQANPGDRCFADFLASYGSEVVKAKSDDKKDANIADTALRALGGGQQRFLGSMRVLASDTKVEHLRKALLTPWRYDDPVKNHTMRWDPMDDVRYALRGREPSGDPEREKTGAVWGANRLAIEALPLLPTAPIHSKLETTGFTQRKGEGAIWTWPIWTAPVGMETVRSLLSLAELQERHPERRRLAAMGVSEVYRSQRITQGKYRNFTPARPA